MLLNASTIKALRIGKAGKRQGVGGPGTRREGLPRVSWGKDQAQILRRMDPDRIARATCGLKFTSVAALLEDEPIKRNGMWRVERERRRRVRRLMLRPGGTKKILETAAAELQRNDNAGRHNKRTVKKREGALARTSQIEGPVQTEHDFTQPQKRQMRSVQKERSGLQGGRQEEGLQVDSHAIVTPCSACRGWEKNLSRRLGQQVKSFRWKKIFRGRKGELKG